MNKKNRNRGIFLILLGIVGIFVSAFYDYVGLGKPEVGLLELSGMIIGAIITATGIVEVFFSDTISLFRALTGLYVIGILCIGLKPNPGAYSFPRLLMDVSNFDWNDVIMNTAGFIPLGYLLMLSCRNRERGRSSNLLYKSIVVAGFGGLISLFLEVSQYYLILGRQSSLFDWISNTFGTLLGIAVYLVLSTNPVAK